MSGSPVTEPAPAGGPEGRRLALIVAVTDYVDSALRRLRAPAGDAAELRDLLADPEIGGFEVTSVVNERAHQLRVAIEDFLSDRRQDDLLLLYLSCHGLVDARRRLYFAARDTLKNRLAASGIESQWLFEQLEDCRARRQVVILDCCFSGAFAHGAKGDDELGLGERLVGDGRGRVVLTASRGSEYSFEGEPVEGEDAARGSVFTSALVEGIRTGRADTDRDGDISVEDAYTFAFDEVRRAGARQTPQRWLYGAEGSILLAHAPPSPAAVLPAPPVAAPAPSADPPAAERTPPGDEPGVAASAAGRPPGRRPRRRTALLAVAGAGAAIAIAVVTAIIVQSREDPGAAGDGNGGAGSTSGTFTEQAPWRLRISDEVDGDDNGCDVTLTNEGSDNVLPWNDLYDVKTFQMRESGTFSWEVNDPGCVVLHLNGDGGVSSLPFTWLGTEGDTPVFESPGSVTVEVRNPQGSSTCDLSLMADDDGRRIDVAQATEAERSVVLESNGPGRAFIAAPVCDIRIGPTP